MTTFCYIVLLIFFHNHVVVQLDSVCELFKGLLNGSCFSEYCVKLGFNVIWLYFWMTELLKSAYDHQ